MRQQPWGRNFGARIYCAQIPGKAAHHAGRHLLDSLRTAATHADAVKLVPHAWLPWSYWLPERNGHPSDVVFLFYLPTRHGAVRGVLNQNTVLAELEMFFIAYNLIRCLIVQASREYAADIQRLSFKGTVDGVRQFSIAIVQARSRKKQAELMGALIHAIPTDMVPERLGRREPRAVKRRPKPCAWLTQPRHKFKDSQHRNRYRKNNPRTIRA
jgi:hypothetical protein